ncbi:uncharacterized protein F4807DRAFT_445891, partial [Annulohypoxylon truncatum]|uniref:uncharacterized protein n=1 Tax=Annulohypoxylon truncatum TaxID=327061 RepID=UPI002008DEF0
MDMIPTFDGKSTSATVLHGDRGIGKSVLSYHLYKSLLQSRQSSDIVVYFSFDVLDRRRRSIMSMLSKIIHQILAVDPKSFSSTIQSPQANDSGLEERNMWALLRSIVQKSKSENITLIVDSVQESDASDLEAVWGNLSKLKDARKTGFRLLCTTDIEPSAATQEKIPSVSIKNQRQFESSWKEFVDRRTNEILSKSPINLEDFKGKLSERLLQPYQFLRPTLIAHHMRLTDSPSTPSCIRNDLDNISKSDLEDTISAIVQKCSSWMKPTIRWLLFARRPLRSLELAVAIALEKSCASSQQPIVDEDLIPQDIAGDLKRQLGPLIDVEDGEIRISHPYTRPILEKRVYPEKQGSKSDHIALTGLCLKYLRRCLEYKSKKGTTPVDDINFEFFEYVVENWHVHYRDPVNDGDKELKLLVDSLLNTGAYLSLLCPLDFTVPSSNDGALYLSVRLGLLDIVEEKLTGSDANKSVLFRIACQYHHVEIVKCFIEGMDDNACIKELHQAMNTADSSLCNVLLDKLLKELQPNDDKLEPTFIAACKIGHEAIANRLVKSGIVIKNISTLLLNEVFDRGHVRIVELLLKERVVTDAPDAYIQNLLEQSKQRGYGSIVELLSSIVEDRRRWGRVITHLEETKTLMLNRFEEVQKIAKGELRSVDQD